MMLHRHDNIIQRALSLREQLTICFIADGVHVHPAALGNYLQLAGVDRSIVVTDAIAAAGLGPGRYALGGRSVNVGVDLVAKSADGSHFVGSTATMPRMVGVLRDQLRLSDNDIQSLLWQNPCRLLAPAGPAISCRRGERGAHFQCPRGPLSQRLVVGCGRERPSSGRPGPGMPLRMGCRA